MDETQQDAASPLPAPLISVPAPPPTHLSNHSGTALSPPQRGKRQLKKTRINWRHKGQCCLTRDGEEDSEE